MRSGTDEIYYIFNILVAAIACAALALALINYREIHDVKNQINLLDKKIQESNGVISDIQEELSRKPSRQKSLKTRQNTHQKKKKSPEHSQKKNNEQQRTEEDKKKKVDSAEKTQKKRTIDAIVSDLVDGILK